MSDRTEPQQPSKKPRPPRPPNLVAQLRADARSYSRNRPAPAINWPRTMYRGTLNALLAKCDWATGRNAFVSKATIRAQFTGADERKVQRDLRHLLAGGWISDQGEPDTDKARLAYYGDGTEEHPGIRADRRPPVYKVNFLVFYAVPRPAGSQFDSSSPHRAGRQNDSPTGRQNGHPRGDTGTSQPSSPSTSYSPNDHASSSSEEEAVQEVQTTPARDETARVGGLDFSLEPPPAQGENEDELEKSWRAPTDKELLRATRIALRMLHKEDALGTDYKFKVQARLKKIIPENGSVCLECALWVPYWAEAHEDSDELKGLALKDDLLLLWGERFGWWLSKAHKWRRDKKEALKYDRSSDSHAEVFERFERWVFNGGLYKDRSEEERGAIMALCRTCDPLESKEEDEHVNTEKRRA